jgi:hypothetical protein
MKPPVPHPALGADPMMPGSISFTLEAEGTDCQETAVWSVFRDCLPLPESSFVHKLHRDIREYRKIDETSPDETDLVGDCTRLPYRVACSATEWVYSKPCCTEPRNFRSPGPG